VTHYEKIKRRQGKGQPRLQHSLRAMEYLLEVTDAGEHRQYGLDPHARIPRAAATQLEIRGIALLQR
jgi:hypothetical protein